MSGVTCVRRGSLLGLACLCAGASSVGAVQQGQETDSQAAADTVQAAFPEGVDEVDRIIAVVGDTAMLMSELQITFFQLEARGARIPPENTPEWTRFARQVLAAEIDRLIVLQQAKRSGLSPDQARVEETVEAEYQRARQEYASDEEMMGAVEGAGMNMLQYRQLLRRQAEADDLFEQYRFALQQRTDLPSVMIPESEIETFFEENQGSQQMRPAVISFNQIVVTPSPSGSAGDSAIARTIRVQNDLLNGEEFEVVARRYSDDLATRDRGGELGWMSRDGLVKPFSDAVWRSRTGQTIGPIKTQFGLHIIKIERQRGAERFLRHILLKPEITQEDIEAVQSVAVQIADSLAAGVDPERLQGLFRDHVADEDIRFDEIAVEQVVARFTGAREAGLASPTPGEVYGPMEYQRGGPTEFAIVHVLTYRPAGPVELDDVRDQIRRNIRISKQLDILLAEVRANTFVDIKL